MNRNAVFTALGILSLLLSAFIATQLIEVADANFVPQASVNHIWSPTNTCSARSLWVSRFKQQEAVKSIGYPLLESTCSRRAALTARQLNWVLGGIAWITTEQLGLDSCGTETSS